MRLTDSATYRAAIAAKKLHSHMDYAQVVEDFSGFYVLDLL